MRVTLEEQVQIWILSFVNIKIKNGDKLIRFKSLFEKFSKYIQFKSVQLQTFDSEGIVEDPMKNILPRLRVGLEVLLRAISLTEGRQDLGDLFKYEGFFEKLPSRAPRAPRGSPR